MPRYRVTRGFQASYSAREGMVLYREGPLDPVFRSALDLGWVVEADEQTEEPTQEVLLQMGLAPIEEPQTHEASPPDPDPDLPKRSCYELIQEDWLD